MVPSKGYEEDLFHAFPLAPGGLLAIVSNPWFVETSLQSLPSSWHGILPVCASVSEFPFFINIPVILRNQAQNAI